MIRIENVTKIYGAKIALDNISFTIKKGDFFALFGKNGAGKSTTINILSTLVKKNKGKIYIDNHDLDLEAIKIKSLIGLVPQEYNFNQFESVIEIILNQAGYHGIKKNIALNKAQKLLKLFELWEYKNIISMKLSGGMKRRLMIVRSLIHEPKILILDEPTAGVDIISRRLIWDFLKKINKVGTTIILTTHYLEEIEKLCNKVVIVNNGKVLLTTTVLELLNKVDTKKYILETKNVIPPVIIKDENFIITKKADKILEISISKDKDLTCLFQYILNNNIIINNIKTENKNLEDILINLIT